MKTRDKAKELILDMELEQSVGIRGYNYDTAKRCALKCVDEILESHLMSVTCENIVIEYWKEVKQEINQL